MSRLDKVQRRREGLIDRAAAQREVIAAAATATLRTPCAVADKGLAAMAFLKARPLLLAGGVAALVAMRPGRALRLGRRGFAVWRGLRVARGLLTALRLGVGSPV